MSTIVDPDSTGHDVSTTDATDSTRAIARERGLWHYLGVSLSTAVLVVVIALAALVVVIPRVAGALPMTVLTSSMEPRLPPGTLVIVKPIDPSALAIGDVATYQIESGKRGVITHRIIAINFLADGDRSFIFQGDNNGAPDDPVLAAQIQGKLWYSIPLLGWANIAINGENRAWVTPVVAGLLFTYAGYSVASTVAASQRKRRRAALLASVSKYVPRGVAPDASRDDTSA